MLRGMIFNENSKVAVDIFNFVFMIRFEAAYTDLNVKIRKSLHD